MNSQNESRSLRYSFRQQIRGHKVPNVIRPSETMPLDTEDAIIGLLPGDEDLAIHDLGGLPTDPTKAHEKTQDRFAMRVKSLALALIGGTISLLAWHRLMRDEVKLHVIQQSLLGGGGTLSDPKRVDGIIRRETDYLSRFADEIAREGKGPQRDRLLNRALLYGGSARGSFYREREAILPNGYVIVYLALDDDSTCKPCSAADGNRYLPGTGPFPGEVCFGRSRCRCIRVPVFNPTLAQSLKVRI